MEVWAALYNPCVCESEAEIISLHRTKGGAEMAIVRNKRETTHSIQKWEVWSVKPYLVQDD